MNLTSVWTPCQVTMWAMFVDPLGVDFSRLARLRWRHFPKSWWWSNATNASREWRRGDSESDWHVSSLHASEWATGVFWVHFHDGDVTVKPVVRYAKLMVQQCWHCIPPKQHHPSFGAPCLLDAFPARLPCWTWWLKPCWCCLPPRFRFGWWLLSTSFN